MESVMWVFNRLMANGNVYEGTRVSLYCTRCGTPISNFEIAMDNSYAEMEDPAVTVKFPITSEGEFKGISVLAWTTTPWTIPSNRALVLDPKEDYVVAETKKTYIELEKAWLLKKLPDDLDQHEHMEIEQAYIKNIDKVLNPDLKEVRIRKVNSDKFTYTTKSFAGGHKEVGQISELTKQNF